MDDVWPIIIGICCAGLFLGLILGFNWGHTYKGDIDTSDCRASAELKEGDWETYWHKFYCSNNSCFAVSTTDGKCDTVYFYTQSKNTD